MCAKEIYLLIIGFQNLKWKFNLNDKITELKEKYSKQGQLLDEEQTDNNKLTEKVEQLETVTKSLLWSLM
jgi:hypothetical protein